MVLFTSNTYQIKRQILSFNDVTFSAIERAATLFQKATFLMDRGYDDNKMF
ncbi:MAG: hypothetical protein ACI317_01500 [Floccifex porci]|uniref:hypothetical protein n=1 Tax=Floccifex porci TaxID=2606629 RepID=UPI003F0CD067